MVLWSVQISVISSSSKLCSSCSILLSKMGKLQPHSSINMLVLWSVRISVIPSPSKSCSSILPFISLWPSFPQLTSSSSRSQVVGLSFGQDRLVEVGSCHLRSHSRVIGLPPGHRLIEVIVSGPVHELLAFHLDIDFLKREVIISGPVHELLAFHSNKIDLLKWQIVTLGPVHKSLMFH